MTSDDDSKNLPDRIVAMADTPRLMDLRRRVRAAMYEPSETWQGPPRIDPLDPAEPVIIRKARAIAAKLSAMPTDLWTGQLLAGSMTLETPRLHAERGFPQYLTDEELEEGKLRGLTTGCFGHIVPDYPTLLAKGFSGILAEVADQRCRAENDSQLAFLDAARVAIGGVLLLAERLARQCEEDAASATASRAEDLREMAANLRHSPAGPARTFWQALQSVWLLHMIFHSTKNGNAMGRLDQYAWPLLQADLDEGRIDLERAMELVGCFCLKFNERAKTTDDQRPEARPEETPDPTRRGRHSTSSQIGSRRDGLDATNHWLQNIVVGGITPGGKDGTNPLAYLLLEGYRRNEMTNPLLTVRVHADSPRELLAYSCDVLKDGGGMPAIFNDDQIIPALERIGINRTDARDYTNDGCWEVIIPGRTNFGFQRVSVMLPLERVLLHETATYGDCPPGPDTGDPTAFESFEDVFEAWRRQLDYVIGRTVDRVLDTIDDKSILAPVPLLSSLIDGCIESRKDMTAGGARLRTYALLAEGVAHCIDSLAAIQTVVFVDRAATMAELCDALAVNFEGAESLRRRVIEAPKYGNDDDRADAVGRLVIDAFTELVAEHAGRHETRVKFPCGVATFSWYVGIGQGLRASADGRLAGEAVSSNFSPALGRDRMGLPGAILSYGKMHERNLPAGGPTDLRLARRLVRGAEGTDRMVALVRSFVASGGNMMTLTVADTEELRAAQRKPDKHESLRVRMGGWSAYFTMLSRDQQDHHIRRQEARS